MARAGSQGAGRDRAGSAGGGRSGGGRSGGSAGGSRAGGAAGGRSGSSGSGRSAGSGRPSSSGRSGSGSSGSSHWRGGSSSGPGGNSGGSAGDGAVRSGGSGGSSGGRSGSGSTREQRAPRTPRGTPNESATWTPANAKGLDGTQIEGRVAVRELLAVGRRRVRSLFMAEGSDESPILQDIERLAAEARIPIRWMSKEMLLSQARTEAPQGVMAICAELEEADSDELLVRQPQGAAQPFLLALDGLTDPGNLGALLRSAQGAGVTGVIMPRHRAVHVTPTVAKAAAGAIEYLPMAVVPGLPAYLLRAKELGAWIIGLDAGGDSTIYDLGHLADQPLIVVVGSEGDGLSRLVRDRCDVVASIPLRGALESLNASVAGAVALLEIGRHRPLSR
jgi:23S rRNA (guanosine2251-2'-O)-methyltransferase